MPSTINLRTTLSIFALILCFQYVPFQHTLAKDESTSTNTQSVVNNVQQKIIDKEESMRISVLTRARKSVVTIIGVNDQEMLGNYLDLLSAKANLSSSTQPLLSSSTDENTSVVQGTGFFINNKGIVMTNKHVVQNLNLYYGVIDEQGTIYSVEDIQKDPVNDIAIIKIKSSSKTIPALSIATKEDYPIIGQTAYTIGDSLGKYTNTVSKGIISGLRRTLVAFGEDNASERLFDTIQTDAAISQGNSGGPLISSSGMILGMNTAFDPQGENIGFAIHAKYLLSAYKAYLAYGYIPKPFLGVKHIKLSTASSKKMGLTSTYGALIISDDASSPIVENSPAAKAGIQKGDIILSVNGELLRGDRLLGDALSLYRMNETVRFVIKRGKDTLSRDITLENRRE